VEERAERTGERDNGGEERCLATACAAAPLYMALPASPTASSTSHRARRIEHVRRMRLTARRTEHVAQGTFARSSCPASTTHGAPPMTGAPMTEPRGVPLRFVCRRVPLRLVEGLQSGSATPQSLRLREKQEHLRVPPAAAAAPPRRRDCWRGVTVGGESFSDDGEGRLDGGIGSRRDPQQPSVTLHVLCRGRPRDYARTKTRCESRPPAAMWTVR